jgi:hypothetical protein
MGADPSWAESKLRSEVGGEGGTAVAFLEGPPPKRDANGRLMREAAPWPAVAVRFAGRGGRGGFVIAWDRGGRWREGVYDGILY